MPRLFLRYRHILALSGCIFIAIIFIYFSKRQKHIEFIIDSPVGHLSKNLPKVKPTSFQPGLDVHHFGRIVISSGQTETEVEDKFYKFLEQKDVICKNDKRLGTQHDGGWNVCMSPPFELIKPCLVYSFGIGNDWRFEDDLFDFYGCQVLAFDPSMEKKEFNRTALIRFKPFGLGGEELTTKKGWKLKTLLTHLLEEGHTNTIIDYLKFDIEYQEWYALQSMVIDDVLRNVKQIGFEIHFKHPQEAKGAELHMTKDDFIRMYEILKLLEEHIKDMESKSFSDVTSTCRNPCMTPVGHTKDDMRCDMRFPTMWYVRPAKAQTSLRICAV